MLRSLLWVVYFSIAALVGAQGSVAAEKMVTIGTAGVTGVYYPAGGAICRLVNRGRKEHGVRCTVESTGGSLNNLDALHKGDLEMAVVQSDLLYHAYTGTEIFSPQGPDNSLRVLMTLHSEPFTVIARRDAGIKNFDDLKGKKVNIGNPGSGMRVTMEELMAKKGWTNKTLQIVDLKASEQAQALCGKQIDAMVYAAGHPNGAIQQVTSMCDTNMVDVTGPVIDDIIKQNPYYAYATIPGGMYLGNPQTTKTFGVKAVLIATEDLSDDVAYEVVKSVFENIDNFKTLHPVFASLDARHMVRGAALLAPLHPGARRYFREKGWVE